MAARPSRYLYAARIGIRKLENAALAGARGALSSPAIKLTFCARRRRSGIGRARGALLTPCDNARFGCARRQPMAAAPISGRRDQAKM